MKIIIKTCEGKSIRIPLPVWLLKLGSSKFVIDIVKKHVSDNEAKYINNMEFDFLRYNLDMLMEYKGLNIVDVASKDGTEVKIIV